MDPIHSTSNEPVLDGHPVPEDNRPGHHPEHEQDRPDPDAFAARFGVGVEGSPSADGPSVDRPGSPIRPRRHAGRPLARGLI